MKTLYVRVKPKAPVEVFHRCAMKFVLAWSEVVVDDATAKRLNEEQMLEVSETKPAGFEPTAVDDVSSLQPAPAPTEKSVADKVREFLGFENPGDQAEQVLHGAPAIPNTSATVGATEVSGADTSAAAPAVVEAPVVEAPVVEAPVVEAPAVDEPKPKKAGK